MNKTEYLQWVVTFLSEVYSRTGKTCLLYSNKYSLDAHLPASHGLGSVPLWIANYNTSNPPLPNGWTDYDMWQYTDIGMVKGISTFVDMNKLKFEEQLIKLVNKTSLIKSKNSKKPPLKNRKPPNL